MDIRRPGLVLLAFGLLCAQPAPPALGQDVQETFDEAVELFEVLQQAEAIPLFGQIIDSLQAGAEARTLDLQDREIFFDSLSFRARAAFNLSNTEVVDEDLSLALGLHPDYRCEERLVTSRLIDRCTALRDEIVGVLDLRVDPPDAEVQVDGRTIDVGQGPVNVIAGTRFVAVNRPGYAGWTETIDIGPGQAEPATREVSLERVSSVLRVMTRPPGATVFVDTVDYGVTDGTAEPGMLLPPTLRAYPIDEFSSELFVPNLASGVARIVVTMEGYRTVRAELELSSAADYPLHFVLERAEGDSGVRRATGRGDDRAHTTRRDGLFNDHFRFHGSAAHRGLRPHRIAPQRRLLRGFGYRDRP